MADGAKQSVVMNVDKESLWSVITDFESYPKFVQGLEKCQVLERKGKVTRAEYHLNMLGKKIKYIAKHTEDPMSRLSWTMESGEMFKSNDGSWDIKELGPQKIEVTYTISVGFPLFVPKAIINTLVGSTLSSMLEAFEEQAKIVAKKAGKKSSDTNKKKKSE